MNSTKCFQNGNSDCNQAPTPMVEISPLWMHIMDTEKPEVREHILKVAALGQESLDKLLSWCEGRARSDLRKARVEAKAREKAMVSPSNAAIKLSPCSKLNLMDPPSRFVSEVGKRFFQDATGTLRKFQNLIVDPVVIQSSPPHDAPVTTAVEITTPSKDGSSDTSVFKLDNLIVEKTCNVTFSDAEAPASDSADASKDSSIDVSVDISEDVFAVGFIVLSSSSVLNSNIQ